MKNWLQSANSCNSGKWILLIEFRYKFLTFYRSNNTCNIVLYYLNRSSFWINYLTTPSLYTIVHNSSYEWMIEIAYILYRLINRDRKKKKKKKMKKSRTNKRTHAPLIKISFDRHISYEINPKKKIALKEITIGLVNYTMHTREYEWVNKFFFFFRYQKNVSTFDYQFSLIFGGTNICLYLTYVRPVR